ncbi:Shedu immune nuclease family protein [Desulfotalea psychrophila]|nr:Shedu immune nuclease family protein [Desulfotalea psychrophila]
MIKFKELDNKILLCYSSDYPTHNWVYHELDKSGRVTISKVFKFSQKNLSSAFNKEDEEAPVEFEVAVKDGEYYRFPKDILSLKHDLYVHEDIKLERRFFVAERNISIFPKIDNMVNRPIYIGGDEEDAISMPVYYGLLKTFPNTNELNKYVSARISGVLSSYIEINDDYEERYQQYLNKKNGRKGANLQYDFSNLELIKFTSISEKLNSMLEDEVSYTEAQWQEELLQIILLLYPKYIHAFKEAPVRDTYNKADRKIDYLLIDSSGNTDIIEIKKPFDKCIVTTRTYRDNYIPLRELSGTVMQIEKYIFYLNKWGKKGEEKLTEHYKDELPENFKIKITNPSGIIIMGRKKGMTHEQVQDFEVIKRKYKNVIDIITYDDLLERLKFTISQWSKTHNKLIQATGRGMGR